MKKLYLEFLVILMIIFRGWSFDFPSGWSTVAFDITTATSPQVIFGNKIDEVEQLIGITGLRFSSWNSSSSSGTILTSLEPNHGYFIKVKSAFSLQGIATYSEPQYESVTGFQLIPLKSKESLNSLTATEHSWSERLYAVWGLHGNHWYAHYPGQNLAYQSALNDLFSTNSVRALTQLTPGQAYFIGLRPLMKKVALKSIQVNSRVIQGAKLNFDYLDENESRPTAQLDEQAFQLGSPLTDEYGNWSGEIFLPQNSSILIGQWQTVQASSSVSGSQLVSNEIMYSSYKLNPASSVESLERLNFSPLSNFVYFERLRGDTQSSTSKLAAHFLNQFVEQDSVGYSPLNTAPMQLFKTSLAAVDPVNLGSFTGLMPSSLESNIFNLSHQLANGIILRKFENSNKFLDHLFSRLNDPNSIENSASKSFLNNLRSGLDTFKQFDSVLSEIFNQGGPSLRYVATESNNHAFMALNALEVGHVPASIKSINDKIAELAPVDSDQFIFTEYPEYIRIPLGSQNSLNLATGMMILTLLNSQSSAPSAYVTAHNFKIARHNESGLCPFDQQENQWKICVQISDNSKINFAYEYIENNFPFMGSGTIVNSIDSGDTNLSKAGYIEIPVLNYVKKARALGSVDITEKFKDQNLELKIETKGIDFSLNGLNDYQFNTFYIKNMRINSI